MAQISKEEKVKAKNAADNFANAHWWGKYTLPEHLSQAFLAGVNYQRQQTQKNGNTEPSQQTGE